MTTVAVLMVCGIAAAGSLIVAVDDHRMRSVAARLIIRIAGLVYRPRNLEFRGELAMLQALSAETGLEYALGALFGASVERVSSVARPLRIEAVSKSYGNIIGVRGVTLEVPMGSITALLGGTGSGKTTLLRLLDGTHRSDTGTIMFDGRPITPRATRGISVIHSDLGLFDEFTVAENTTFTRRGRWILGKEQASNASWALLQIGSRVDPCSRVRDLTQIERVEVTLAKALLDDAQVIVLDEPTAGLDSDGIRRLFASLDRLRQRGLGILFVSHRVDDIFQIANRVAVLHDGLLVHDAAVDETSPDAVVHHIVVGAGNPQ